MIKPSRIAFHYLLALTMLFASSFAMFHSSEHLTLEKPRNDAQASFVPYLRLHIQHEYHHYAHSSEEHAQGGAEHAIESLCEACLLLSGQTAHISHDVLSNLFSAHFSFTLLSQMAELNHFYLNYLSRAPPCKV